MQNFENKISQVEKILKNIRGTFDKNKVEFKLSDLEKKAIKRRFLER